MKAYGYSDDKKYIGLVECQESPLEPGVFLVPGNATLIPPPSDIPEGKEVVFNGTEWELVDLPSVAEPVPTE